MKVSKSLIQTFNTLLVLNLCTSIAGAVPGTVVAPELSQSAAHRTQRPHMDVAFCIDTTGSMQAEIDMVKSKTKEMVAKLSAGKPAPIIRVGLVAYRDKGDDYVTKVFPFSDDIDQVVKDISSLKAHGGGDGPEAVDQGLHAAVKELQWDSSSHTAKLLFLIGDAGPHGYKTDVDWRKDCRDAIADGIQINTMGCHGLESYPEQQGTAVFKEIAKLTDGKYESLAYRQEIVDSSGKRSTVVSSAGAMYKVAPGYAGAWKGAVAHGRLEKVTAMSSVSTYYIEDAALAGAPMAAPMPSAAKSLAVGRATTRGFAPAGGAGIMSVSQSRADNNLDELMLGAAKDKAEKTLHVGY